MSTLVGYGAVTAAGPGAAALWEALTVGRALRDEEGVCRWADTTERTALERLVAKAAVATAEALADHRPGPRERWGIVLASTKGVVEDETARPDGPESRDPLAPLLDGVVERLRLRPLRRLAVSNACVSSHAALWVAERWLGAGLVDDVLVLAVDEARDFVVRGFRALGALSPTVARPMAEDRDGLQLGEAAVALWLSRERPGPFVLGPIGLETEGLSITRPSPDGESLVRAARVALADDGAVDFVVAHGTGTLANDLVEAGALARTLAAVGADRRTPVVATKGCVGHTLGASGAVDVVAAAECLRRGALFPIGTTTRPDPALPVAAFFAGSSDAAAIAARAPEFRRALVSGLGFGGVHAAVTIARAGGAK